MYGPDAYAVRNVGGRIRRKKTIKNTTLQKESSFRPVVVRRPVRAPESAMSFMATVVFVHAPGFSFGDFPDSLSRLAQRTGCKE